MHFILSFRKLALKWNVGVLLHNLTVYDSGFFLKSILCPRLAGCIGNTADIQPMTLITDG